MYGFCLFNLNLFRCELVLNCLPSEPFLKDVELDLPPAVKHDFLAKTQTAYFTKVKSNVEEGEFIISLDFAENYTCQVQDAVQSQHWANIQATLHTYVVYYKERDVIKNINYVMISENLSHDASAVQVFNQKLIANLKQKFDEKNVKKLNTFRMVQLDNTKTNTIF